MQKKKSIPVFYYITPKVWAWKKSRIKKIKKYVDHCALILPFEENIFKKEKIPATFVGHPLLDYYTDNKLIENQKEENKNFMIGLLPGSRESEISNLLETMLRSARMIYKHNNNIKFLVSVSLSVNISRFKSILEFYNHDGIFELVHGSLDEIFKKSNFLIAASGTVTLEAAICGIPMIIIYKMSFLSFFLAKTFVKIKYVGLANIIANYEIVPELLQDDATPEKIADKTISIIDKESLKSMKHKLLMVRKLLGGTGASFKTASIAVNYLDLKSKA